MCWQEPVEISFLFCKFKKKKKGHKLSVRVGKVLNFKFSRRVKE